MMHGRTFKRLAIILLSEPQGVSPAAYDIIRSELKADVLDLCFSDKGRWFLSTAHREHTSHKSKVNQ